MLLHAGGITLSQPLNDTVALVRAPGAGGVSVVNQVGVKTDDRGYAVVPYLSAYRQNMIALDPTTLADDVELGLTSQTVIPTRGAVVLADYQTKVGSRLMVTLTRADGRPVPFGATASLMGSEDGGSIVGDGGLLFWPARRLAGRCTCSGASRPISSAGLTTHCRRRPARRLRRSRPSAVKERKVKAGVWTLCLCGLWAAGGVWGRNAHRPAARNGCCSTFRHRRCNAICRWAVWYGRARASAASGVAGAL